MPLRSVEAASRDDAIAAARDQFGPQARVVGVRRVRSGGVLGFFATERYVAEVAADPAGRPVGPVPASARTADTDPVDVHRDDLYRDEAAPADFSSPLASAAPARARATVPARNGAAAWAAEAAPRTSDGVPAGRTPARTPAARSAAPVGDIRTAVPARNASPVHPVAAAPRVDDERVSELAGLLTLPESGAATPTYSRTTFPRAAFPRTGSPAGTGGPLDDDDEPARDGDHRVLPAAASGAPSPFTAALARMVAGDRDVRQAVKQALDQPAAASGRAAVAPSPTWPGPLAPAESPVSPPAARQEEETVGDQVIAPPSPVTDRAAVVPTWAAEPEIAAASVSPREEAIADLLRGALAQGHSDEALAGILRKVLAGAAPQTALAEPEAPAPAPAPQVVLADNLLPDDAPADDLRTDAAPEQAVVIPAVLPDAAPAADEVAEVAQVAGEQAPEPGSVEAPEPARQPYPWTYESTDLFGEVTAVAAPSLQMWGIPMAEVPLWGEPVTTASLDAPIRGHADAAADPAVPVDAPIWDEVTPDEVPAPDEAVAAIPAAPAVEAAVPDLPSDSGIFASDDPVADAPASVAAVEAVTEQSEVLAAEESVEEYVAASEVEIAELAPMLARTASDPAPMMSLDATTVMPPLSLLPPLPSSRGRGRPPVPTSLSRSSAARPGAPKPAPATPEKADQEVTTSEVTTPERTAPEADLGAAGGLRRASSDTPPAQRPRVDAGLFDEPTVATPVARASSARPPVVETSAQSPAPRFLATVTRLPVAPLMAGPETPEMPDLEDLDESEATATPPATEPVDTAPAAPVGPAPLVPSAPGGVAGRLQALGVPAGFLGASFADDVAAHGTYAALTRALALRLSKAPELPSGAGEVLFVVGPGVETLRAAQSLAASLRLDPDRVQWASRGDLSGLAPKGSRMTTVETAIDRRQDAADAGTVTIVAVDAPLRSDAYWMAQMLAIWSPVAVWAVVEATRKPEDLEPWIDGLPRVDALVVQDTDLSADPAAVLRQVDIPVALLDGVPATPHRWASLLCERLESTKA